jgi:glutaminyl-tRNA synthetase
MLDHSLRQDLKARTISVMAVLQPLKVVITNYPEGHTELLAIENNSENEALGKREVPFSKTIYIERDDFAEQPIKGFHRLSPNAEVRLKGAYFIKCEEVIKDPDTGEITELHCTYDPLTKSGTGFTGRKVKGTIHWVAADYAVKADVHLYDSLLLEPNIPDDDGEDWAEVLNPHSLVIVKDSLIELGVGHARPEQKFQFFRHGYFCVDRKLAADDRLVFNRIVPLKDGWNKR